MKAKKVTAELAKTNNYYAKLLYNFIWVSLQYAQLRIGRYLGGK